MLPVPPSLLALLTTIPVGVLQPVAPPAQRQDDAAIERILDNMYLERRTLFEDAWFAAEQAGRDRARELLLSRGAAGLPALYSVPALALGEAHALLLAPVSTTGRSIATRLAESIDLQVMPGAFTSGQSERGEHMIVRVLPAYTRAVRGPLPSEFQLTLIWVAPDGREIRAQREPIAMGAMRLPGFEMYFRAPASPVGTWRLVPEVAIGEEAGRGVGVPVESVQDLWPRFDAIMDAQVVGERTQACRERISRMLERGERDPGQPGIGELLQPDGVERMWIPAPCSIAPEDSRTFALEPPEVARIVVVSSAGVENPLWSLQGRTGQAWQSLSSEHSAMVVVTSRALRGSVGPGLFELLDALDEAHPEAPITLLVRGSQCSKLSIALGRRRGEVLPFDELVQDTVLFGEGGPRRMFDFPTLVFEPLEDREGTEVLEEGLVWVTRTDPPHISSLELPGVIGSWWSGEFTGDGR